MSNRTSDSAEASSPDARPRAALDAIVHGVTGQNLLLTASELPAYLRLGMDYIEELRPVGVRETQTAQQIVDTNWRLNRVAALENNLLNGALLQTAAASRTSDNRLTAMVAQSETFRADCQGPNAFDKLGRYEARLSRTLFRLTEELERLQAVRLARAEHGEDVFVLSDCPAWRWYNGMVEAIDQSEATRPDIPRIVPSSSKKSQTVPDGSREYSSQAPSPTPDHKRVLKKFAAS